MLAESTPLRLETAGNSVAIRCLLDVINASGIQRKVLAAECGYSDAQFSKIANGQQGSLLDLIYRLPPHRAALRAEFFRRLADAEGIDPVTSAIEQVMVAAVSFLRLAAAAGVKPRMAKARVSGDEDRSRPTAGRTTLAIPPAGVSGGRSSAR